MRPEALRVTIKPALLLINHVAAANIVREAISLADDSKLNAEDDDAGYQLLRMHR